MKNPKQIAELWLHAFNAHDLEKLLELYSSDAVHYSPKLKLRNPKTNGMIKGKETLYIWWKDAFEQLPTLKYLEQSITANENQVFMEYIRKVSGEENLLVAEILEIKDGLIVKSRVYHG